MSLPVGPLSLPEFFRWCLLSRCLWFVVCFGKLSLSDIAIRNNQAASDRASGQSPFAMTLSPIKDWILAMLTCEVWDVAPSCWKYPIESSSSSNWFTNVLKISIYAAVVMFASKKLGPILRRRDILHQTPIFSEWRRTADTHYKHIPLHFSHNEFTPVQISLQYFHLC